MSNELIGEIREHLLNKIIPFWNGLRDDEFGGYYGFMDYDLVVDRTAVKGCILNSRITWFYTNAYMLLGDEKLLDQAKHGYEFLKNSCMDKENGGVFWTLKYDGTPDDTMKHTYNQAFAIYALSSYYDATKDPESLKLAFELFRIIETKCRDEEGYLEAFDKDFHEIGNEALSENGVMAERTMNTLLHVLEGYTELYRVSGDEEVRVKLYEILKIFADKVYNPELRRLEVFFDLHYNSILDLHSYGHDIEASWLVDRTLEILEDPELDRKIKPITLDLAKKIFERAYDGHSIMNECEKGVDNVHRIWWGQAEAVVGFTNLYSKEPGEEYKEAPGKIWEFISRNLVDKREGGEWFWEVNPEGKPYPGRPIVEPWKCPYHNGRMCFEMIRRNEG